MLNTLWEMFSGSVGVPKMQGNLQVPVPASSQGCLRALEVERQRKWKGKRRWRKVRQREKKRQKASLLRIRERRG